MKRICCPGNTVSESGVLENWITGAAMAALIPVTTIAVAGKVDATAPQRIDHTNDAAPHPFAVHAALPHRTVPADGVHLWSTPMAFNEPIICFDWSPDLHYLFSGRPGC